MTFRIFWGCALLLAGALSGCRGEPQVVAEPPARAAAQSGAPSQEAADTIPLTIRSQGGVRDFDVELAVTPAEQTRGLMFRESLPENGGMLFPFPAPRMASFWMRNTLIPLDMIFIRDDRTIANIAARTTPYSLDSVISDGPVIAVLEIAGGRSAELGIAPGDRVLWGDALQSAP